MPWTVATAICKASTWALAGSGTCVSRACAQLLDGVGDVQLGESCQHGYAACRSLWITGAGFLNDKLRDVEIKLPTMIIPPIVRHLLVGRRDQVTTGPRSEVTGYRGFKVHLGSHKQKANRV